MSTEVDLAETGVIAGGVAAPITGADAATVTGDRAFERLIVHARDVGSPKNVIAVEQILSDAGSAVPFVLVADVVGSHVVARFGLLVLVGRGRARILSPGPLTNASVVALSLP